MRVVLEGRISYTSVNTMGFRRLCLYTATLLIAVGLVPAGMAAAPSSPSTAQSGSESANVWGGEHVRMELTEIGADLDFDCAMGTIDQPLALPAAGRFQARGTYTQERGGPVTKDGNQAVAATYVGTIKGDSMQLEIVLVSSKETVGTYELVRGSSGHVVKCR
jgi:hypothetical protein